MKIKQTNEEGEEVEVDVLTQEEVDTKIEEVNKEWETKFQEKDDSLSALNTEKEDLEKKLDELNPEDKKEDNPNFKILKESLNKKDEDIKDLKEEINSDRKQRVEESYNNKIKGLAKGNEDLEKKIRLHLSSTLVGMEEKTEADRIKKIEAAYKLSADAQTSTPGVFDIGITGAGKGSDITNNMGSENTFSSQEKALGRKLGITDEDYKKYSSRVSKRQ